jgi:hypothetical protein
LIEVRHSSSNMSTCTPRDVPSRDVIEGRRPMNINVVIGIIETSQVEMSLLKIAHLGNTERHFRRPIQRCFLLEDRRLLEHNFKMVTVETSQADVLLKAVPQRT